MVQYPCNETVRHTADNPRGNSPSLASVPSGGSDEAAIAMNFDTCVERRPSAWGETDVNLFAIRHGETEWSLSGQHTGVTDIPLTESGRRLAAGLRVALANEGFALVLASPLRRARETCELAGLGDRLEIDADLSEWNYGDYEGLTSEEIAARSPNWMIFRDGCPGGEMPEQVASRADRVIGRVRASAGDAVLFAHGHFLRVLAARWLGFPAAAGRHFLLDTGTLSVLGYYRETPAVKIWNAPLAH